jgi:electron transfer flavoprotein alpha/beta subunit
MKAKSKPIEEINAVEIEPYTSVLTMEIPRKQRKGIILTDTDEDINELIRLLHEDAKVI